MNKKLLALALGVLLTMPCVVSAEEVVIQLMEVIQMTPLPGDNPLDGPDLHPNEPPCLTCFHATIDVNTLSIKDYHQESISLL